MSRKQIVWDIDAFNKTVLKSMLRDSKARLWAGSACIASGIGGGVVAVSVLYSPNIRDISAVAVFLGTVAVVNGIRDIKNARRLRKDIAEKDPLEVHSELLDEYSGYIIKRAIK